MDGVASSATSVVMAHVADGTKTIRIGSGGIMLPNHSPLVIAEQFGTLERFTGRIDLGVGRAPGTDRMTSLALRRDVDASANRFPQDVPELRAYLEPAEPNQAVRAIPGAGASVPIWMLGLQPLRCATRRDARPALSLRFALRARAISSKRT